MKKPAILTMRALPCLLNPFEMDFYAAKPFCTKTVKSPIAQIKKPADLSAAGESTLLGGRRRQAHNSNFHTESLLSIADDRYSI
jgi:hypothetical protein